MSSTFSNIQFQQKGWEDKPYNLEIGIKKSSDKPKNVDKIIQGKSRKRIDSSHRTKLSNQRLKPKPHIESLKPKHYLRIVINKSLKPTSERMKLFPQLNLPKTENLIGLYDKSVMPTPPYTTHKMKAILDKQVSHYP